jgi:hypothetical protein
LIRQVDETLSSNKAIQLLTVAKQLREGRGSEDEVEKLKTAKRTHVTRPALIFKKSDAIMKECVREAMTATIQSVKIEVEVPEVAVKKQFQCGPETDVRIFSLCPMDNNAVTVSYERQAREEGKRTLRILRLERQVCEMREETEVYWKVNGTSTREWKVKHSGIQQGRFDPYL